MQHHRSVSISNFYCWFQLSDSPVSPSRYRSWVFPVLDRDPRVNFTIIRSYPGSHAARVLSSYLTMKFVLCILLSILTSSALAIFESAQSVLRNEDFEIKVGSGLLNVDESRLSEHIVSDDFQTMADNATLTDVCSLHPISHQMQEPYTTQSASQLSV